MLSLSDVKYTIWEYTSPGWYIVEAIDGTQDEAKDRADELRTLYPDCTYAVRTAYPMDGERLKNAFYFGRSPDEK
jgi:hypothetical protein